MSSGTASAIGELRKLPAFARRDFLVAVSYRTAFLSELAGVLGQVVIFYFVGRLVDSSKLPRYGDTQVTYLQFAAIGIGIALFFGFGLQHVARTVRTEQLMGTFDSLIMTPATWLTIQVGSVAFEFLFLVVRLAVFVAAIAIAFGLDFRLSGVLPAAVLVAAFFPFVWGLGIVSAGLVVTFRRGAGLVGIGSVGLALVSGLYFPTDLLPRWLADTARWNPVARVTNGVRDALVTGSDWTTVAHALAVIVPASLISLVVGALCFRLAVARERQRGTLGVY